MFLDSPLKGEAPIRMKPACLMITLLSAKEKKIKSPAQLNFHKSFRFMALLLLMANKGKCEVFFFSMLYDSTHIYTSLNKFIWIVVDK